MIIKDSELAFLEQLAQALTVLKLRLSMVQDFKQGKVHAEDLSVLVKQTERACELFTKRRAWVKNRDEEAEMLAMFVSEELKRGA